MSAESSNTTPNATYDELNRRICQICEPSSTDFRVIHHITLGIIEILEDGITDALANMAPTNPAGPPAVNAPLTLPPPYVARPSANAAPFTPQREPATGPTRTTRQREQARGPVREPARGPIHEAPAATLQDIFLCITVGRRVGVFSGPL